MRERCASSAPAVGMHELQNSTKQTLKYTILVVLLIGGAGLALVAFDIHDPRQLTDLIRGAGYWGPAFIVFLMILHSFVPVPAEVLAIAAGAALGTIVGAISIWIGAMLGAIISYGLARWIGADGLRRIISPKKQAALEKWSQDPSPAALLIARLVPAIAFNLINYAAGLARVPFLTFLWTTAIGISPLVILSTYVGSEMSEMSWRMLLTVSAISITVVLIGWAVMRTIHKAR